MSMLEAEKAFREKHPNIDDMPEHVAFLHDRITLAFRSGYNAYAAEMNDLLESWQNE